MFSSIQSLLLRNEAVRKHKESSFSHLYANPEASGCFRSISRCKESATLTFPSFTWLQSQLRLDLQLLCSRPTWMTEKKAQLLASLISTGVSWCASFNLSSPIQSETPWNGAGRKRGDVYYGISNVKPRSSDRTEPRLSKMHLGGRLKAVLWKIPKPSIYCTYISEDWIQMVASIMLPQACFHQPSVGRGRWAAIVPRPLGCFHQAHLSGSSFTRGPTSAVRNSDANTITEVTWLNRVSYLNA